MDNYVENLVYEQEIDVMQLFRLLMQHWWQIGLLALLWLILGTGLVYGFKEDVYTANSSMIVQVTNTTDSDYSALLMDKDLWILMQKLLKVTV